MNKCAIFKTTIICSKIYIVKLAFYKLCSICSSECHLVFTRNTF